jgi:hypothetical protein
MNDTRLVQLAGLLADAKAIGLELVRETAYLPQVHHELISVVGHVVAAHVGTKDVTATALLTVPLEQHA